VFTQVKDPGLVAQRRRQIIDAAVLLFVQKGFHKTTTREIARAANISIGSLYEYVASKEDILYLVCDAIHAEMEHHVAEAIARASSAKEVLAEMIREYFLVCHRMSDAILLIYQEAKSLPSAWRKKVFENELRVTSLFVNALSTLMDEGQLPSLPREEIELAAHDITVWGHMWAFRRWHLSRRFTIEEYTKRQTALILASYAGAAGRASVKRGQ
jgi:AcrR family transcriptional regulator